MTSPRRPSGTAKLLLFVAVLIVVLEALTFVVLAILELGSLNSDRLGSGIGVTLFFIAFATGLAWAARLLWAGESHARSPLVFAQLIALGLAWNFKDDSTSLAIAVAVPAAIALGCLLAPTVTRALNDENPV